MARTALGAHKDVEKLARLARKEGWVVTITKGNHIKFIPPDKQKEIVIAALTGSDHRSTKNLQSKLRSSGLNI